MKCSVRSVVLFASFVLGVVNAVCPIGYASYDNQMCYKVISSLASRYDAASRCSSEGGNLASIHDGFTNAYIYSLATQTNASYLWLGFKCSGASANTCFNDDRTLFGPYTNFYPNNPNALSSCVYMSARNPSTQLWFSFDCNEPFSFICEKPYAFVQIINTTTVAPTTTTRAPVAHCLTGYQLFQNMCYKYVNTTWTIKRAAAATICESFKNGTLASIHNGNVNQFLTTLSGNDDAVWIGLACFNVNSNGDTSNCFWEDNTNFDYNGFAKSNPNKLGGNCVNFAGGKWTNYNGADCTKGSNYICQAPPTYY